MKLFSFFLAALTAINFCTGCRLLEPSKSMPVLENELDGKNREGAIFGIDATRRAIIFPGRNPDIPSEFWQDLFATKSAAQDDTNKLLTLLDQDKFDESRLLYNGFVAEPSPDVFEEIAKAYTAAFEATSKLKSDENINAQARVASSFANSAQMLGARSQGVILFRDASYRLAEARLNGWLNDTQYNDLMQVLIEACEGLIKEQLELTDGHINSPTETQINPDLLQDTAHAVNKLKNALEDTDTSEPGGSEEDPKSKAGKPQSN